MLYLTRRFSFSAAHRLHSPRLTPAENADAFGACTSVHGHNYRLEVTVRGEPDPKTGFFCNVLTFAALVNKLVVEPSDHRLLNEVPLFVDAHTTMEGLSQRIWQVLEPELRREGMTLSEVLLAETDEHWVRVRRE
jgi:6-pyruvoyltetrahydropterin/6-carboxytetrahydropterin synthase